jgi:hypothetical protein
MMSKMTSFAELVISLNLALAGISWVKVFSHTKKPVF